MLKPKILVILGPTAVGKSDLAVELAHKFNGEVVSADSRQVYTGLNIGSGKITKKETKGIFHHLLDCISPKKIFSVSMFQELAIKAIYDIHSRGKLPIICGGTGLYIQSIVDGIVLPEVEPNMVLRKQLSDKTAEELYENLKKLDPKRAKTIERKNKVRLIRAIEIAKTLGKVPPLKSDILFTTLQIGLDTKDDVLKEKIKKRLEMRLKKGMLAEAKKLHKQGLSWKRMESFGLEYRYEALYLQGKITRNEMAEKIINESWHFVKRQRTWFRKDMRIKWYEPENLKKIEKEVNRFLKD